MKLLYGVVGEGMGHAIRSRVMIEHLLESGHEVEIMASSRAADFLSKRFANVHRIHGMHIIYEENRVRRSRTVASNIAKGLAALPKQIRAYFELIDDFRPKAVISDFESWTYDYAKLHGLPVISVDNMQVINRCEHEPEIIGEDKANFEMTRLLVKGKLPGCLHYLITTFFYPPVRKDRTTLVPPILRPEILETQASRGEHLLVYQTAEAHGALIEALARSGFSCKLYGVDRSLTQDRVEGDLTFRPFDETEFVRDMASARAVIAGGGFTTMGECVYFKKPLLSVPVVGQFEQVLNGRYLQKLGYGLMARSIDEDVLSDFLRRLEFFEDNLNGYSQRGNQVTFQALDEQLDRVAAGLT